MTEDTGLGTFHKVSLTLLPGRTNAKNYLYLINRLKDIEGRELLIGTGDSDLVRIGQPLSDLTLSGQTDVFSSPSPLSFPSVISDASGSSSVVSSLDGSGLTGSPPAGLPSFGRFQFVVDVDGWLNFTATEQAATMRRIFFCLAENLLGKIVSRKMIVHQ
ncbi:unnamed protein product, partial [Protopolystoma xenopodis]